MGTAGNSEFPEDPGRAHVRSALSLLQREAERRAVRRGCILKDRTFSYSLHLLSIQKANSLARSGLVRTIRFS